MTASRYVAPDTVEEILTEMSEQPGDYTFMAGGTIIQPLLSSGSWLPPTVIGLWRAPLDTLERVNGTISVGSNVRLRDVAVANLPGGLSAAARQVGSPGVRNRATLGGNIATGRGDLIVPLLALDAKVTLVSPQSAIDAPIDSLVDEVTGETSGFAQGLLLTRVLVPASPVSAAYVALGRKTYNTPRVASVCVVATFDPDRPNVLEGVRVAIHGPQPWPLRVRSVEHVLEGRELNAAAVNDAESALEEVGHGFSDAVASASYRSRMSRVVLRRAMEELAGGSLK